MPEPSNALDEEIINDIIKGKCVLFLGPELLIDKEGKYYKTFFKQLADSNRGSILKYFSKDNLFSLVRNDGADFRSVARKVTNFYSEAGDQIILNLISQLPFPLVINVSPDIALNQIFIINNYAFRSAYFPGPRFSNIEEPSISSPVIYNIFGSIEDNQSIIVTHKDLFQIIKSLMQKDSIPLSIYNFLKEANSFIFLGLKFETWYYQLLLSILDIDKYDKSFRIGAEDNTDQDAVSVMNSFFQIEFSKQNPLSIVQNIFSEVKRVSPGSLRTPICVRSTGVAYLSYAWNDIVDPNSAIDNGPGREDIVDKIYNNLTADHKVNVFRDRNVLTIQDSITSFMNRIGQGKAVIIVVSEKYLRSEFCMYEAWEIYKNNNFLDRAFLVVLPDVDLTNIEDYIVYWRTKKNELGNDIKEKFDNDFFAVDSLMARNKTIFYIYLFINDFLKILQDTIHFHVSKDDTSANDKNLEAFITKIMIKINEQ